MSTSEPYLPATDMARFLGDLSALVQLTDTDLATVRRTAPLVLEHEAALTTALYEHFLSIPATARFFLREDGTPDTDRLERRKHSLGRWLRETAAAALTPDFGYYLLSMGLSHSHRPHGPGGRVPAFFVVGAMSLAQTALAQLFVARLGNPQTALEASLAWNKLLLVHLGVLLLGYQPGARA
jgi:hypothetical protein